MGELTAESITHLEQALETDDPREKDFHIRQVMQATGMGDPIEERRVK